MKKVLKIIGTILLVIAIIIGIFLIWLSKRPAVADDYTSKIKTGGAIETKYLAMGSHEVSYLEQPVMQDFKKYEIYYPKDIVLKHLASWGFIVMATEEENSWNGFSSEMCLRSIIKYNETESIEGWELNPFYNHVDLDNIGVSGHSQGGVGVINAASENKHGNMIKAIFAASPTNMTLAEALQWDYDPRQLSVPVFLVSSTGNTDENLVVSGEQLKEIYTYVPDNVTKVMARRINMEHGDMLSVADGYMTAWFMWLLKGDEEASKAFIGNNAEITKNALYQDQLISAVNE